MSSRSTNLFHTRIAPRLNLQRLSVHRGMKLPMAAEGKRTAAQRKNVSATFDQVSAVLSRGDELKAP
jgi:hypothetical protein